MKILSFPQLLALNRALLEMLKTCEIRIKTSNIVGSQPMVIWVYLLVDWIFKVLHPICQFKHNLINLLVEHKQIHLILKQKRHLCNHTKYQWLIIKYKVKETLIEM